MNISKENMALIGFMATGKTSVGKLLASKCGYDFVDIDSKIEKQQGIKITEIFKRYGEIKFRQIEAEIIRKISNEKKKIISVGGGAVLNQKNMDNLSRNGIIICLIASAKTILNRIKNNTDRPLLPAKNPLKKIEELLDSRKQHYKKADIIISTDNKTKVEIVEEIIWEIYK